MNKIVIIVAVVVIVGAIAIIFGGNKKSNNVEPTQIPVTTAPTLQTQGKEEMQEAVSLTTSGFEPQTVAIKAGTRVVWTNKSGEAATVNSAIHPTHLVYPPLNLGEFADGQSVSLVFDKAGTYKYHDHLNPARTGTVVVE